MRSVADSFRVCPICAGRVISFRLTVLLWNPFCHVQPFRFAPCAPPVCVDQVRRRQPAWRILQRARLIVAAVGGDSPRLHPEKRYKRNPIPKQKAFVEAS
jgi:hypothetical protein